MKILLSPTKKMKEDRDSLCPASLPACLSKTRQILDFLRGLDGPALQKLWGCNDSIAEQNLLRLRDMDLEAQLTPAILAYEGIAFQHMAPTVFSDREMQYVQDHLRILSGFYGVLKPLDGIRSYRLEMQARAPVAGCRDLYEFWGRDLYEGSRDESGIFLNLASKEYYQCISRYLTPEDTFITCTFGETVGGKIHQKATYAKMARGEMVRYLAELDADRPEQMQGFDRLGFSFQPQLSTHEEYVFLRNREETQD